MASNRYISHGHVAEPPKNGKKQRLKKVFMDDIDFSYLSEKSRKIKREASSLEDWTMQMQNEADSHRKNNIMKDRERVAEILDKLSDDLTSFIEEFYRRS